MSESPTKSARELAMEEYRRKGHRAIIDFIKNDFAAEKNANRKEILKLVFSRPREFT